MRINNGELTLTAEETQRLAELAGEIDCSYFYGSSVQYADEDNLTGKDRNDFIALGRARDEFLYSIFKFIRQGEGN